MRKHVTLITGAGGEIGHGLIERLAAEGDTAIITIDLKKLEPEISAHVEREYQGSILETHLLERILSEYEVERIYHLAAILSTRAEFTPVTGHQVNVEGTLKLLDFAQAQGESHGRAVVFLYPSSIAAYGLRSFSTPPRSRRMACRTSRPRPPPARCRNTSGTIPPPCTVVTSSIANTWVATMHATTSNWPPKSFPAKWTSVPSVSLD
jgi:nucleoside-diphosphate-sugar epimerase